MSHFCRDSLTACCAVHHCLHQKTSWRSHSCTDGSRGSTQRLQHQWPSLPQQPQRLYDHHASWWCSGSAFKKFWIWTPQCSDQCIRGLSIILSDQPRNNRVNPSFEIHPSSWNLYTQVSADEYLLKKSFVSQRRQRCQSWGKNERVQYKIRELRSRWASHLFICICVWSIFGLKCKNIHT